jgi:hypothetical protein
LTETQADSRSFGQAIASATYAALRSEIKHSNHTLRIRVKKLGLKIP